MKDIIERLRDNGLTLTPQRMAIAEFLSKSRNHPTVDEIHRNIQGRYPTISLATVYSTLKVLKELGEIQELSIRKRDKVCFDPDPNIHHHLLCRKCGKIVDFEFDYPINCPIMEKEEINGSLSKSIMIFLCY